MKTIAGKILSSKRLPVAQGRSFLSEFVNTDTGASQAVGAYLRRATASFDELLRAHSKSRRRQDSYEGAAPGDRVSLINNGGLEGGGVKGGVGGPRDGEGKTVIEVKGDGGFGDGENVKHKKKKMDRERGSLEENGSVVRDKGIGIGIEPETKKEEGDGEVKREDGGERRLKRKIGGGDEEKEVGTEERKQSKKRKDGEDDH